MLSQYANSPKYVSLYNSLCDLFSNAQTMEDWYNIVFNLKTAQGYGLDVWGSILNKGRLLTYKNPKLIDLAIREGIVTLRSGSVVWSPNGTSGGIKQYRKTVIPRDITLEPTLSGNGEAFVFYTPNGLVVWKEEDVLAKNTLNPTPVNQDAIRYNGDNNLMETTDDGGTTWASAQYSFPVAKITYVDGVVTGFENIFNGFFYMYNLFGVLPGVYGYFPNGFNTENQKINEYFEVDSVLTTFLANSVTGNSHFFIASNNGNLYLAAVENYSEGTIEPTSFPCVWLDTNTNTTKYKISQDGSWSDVLYSMVAEFSATNSIIGSLSISEAYTDRDETIYLQGAQTVNGVPYTDEQIEDLYRTTLFLKAMQNITNATLQSINSMFLEFFSDKGVCFAYEYDVMKLRVVVGFFTTKIERAIFTNLLPKPTGVLMGMEFIEPGQYFGHYVAGYTPEEQPYAPLDQKPFYW